MHFKKTTKFFTFIVFAMASHMANSATVEQTVKISLAGGALCMSYAEEVGGDVKIFQDLNAMVLLMADKLGYTKDLNIYLEEVRYLRDELGDQLLEVHKTKLRVYNNWCVRFYNGVVDQVQKWS